ncbi:autotransporter outer membrane beta-barrel domain-containing protein [Pseudomonas schmalbachii]|uniref:Autotransporter domain-containing protein n=1 Tax=Pseudomonas schmalbachii TaxID=2816993 RepID=A0ABS3TT43_9PSED|nr:autotransporter domain-containing protein [Pseudomonas schmalbachii]MBO3275835.1 autotransporter domain-containing protein [Pseudomonas schmalbachii]
MTPAVVRAGCDNHAPASGQTVTCSPDAPNPDPVPVLAAPGSSDVTVNVLPDAAISVENDDGILLREQSRANNGGTITTLGDGAIGMEALGDANVLNNSGTIATAGDAARGLSVFGANNSLINAAGGRITTLGANANGLHGNGASNTLINHGSIDVSGDNAHGITVLGTVGTVSNTGTITSHDGLGVFTSSAVSLSNRGTIVSQQATGILANGGATIDNAGSISGGNIGITVAGGGASIVNSGSIAGLRGAGLDLDDFDNSVVNSGNISSGNGRTVQFGLGNDRFTITAGSIDGNVLMGDGNDSVTLAGGQINGDVVLGAGNDSVRLFTGAILNGTLDSSGGGIDSFAFDGDGNASYGIALGDFQNIAKDGAGTWELTGATASGSALTVSAGTLILSGATPHVGSTTISGGTLQIGNGGTTGSVPGDILNDGTLVFDRSDAVTYAGTISGSGSLTKNGAGLLTLTGDNTYSGLTTISGGILQLGDGGTSGSVAGDIVNDAALVFDRSDAVTYAGVISGSGALIKNGAELLVLAGNNTYSGLTTINGGILQLGDGGASGSVAGDIANDGALVFDRSDAVTYAGAIGGSGSLTKNGAGALTLTGASTYSGTTTVASGALIVDGSIAGSAVTVNSGARLAGGGTLGAASLDSGSVIAPGNSIGTLTVAGDLSFAPGSLYEAEIDPTLQSDLIRAGGAASIGGGTVQALMAPGLYPPGRRWTIVEAAGGVGGTFDALTASQTLPFVDLTLAYDPTHVYIDSIRNDAPFDSVADPGNQAAVADGVDSLGTGSPAHDAVAASPDAASARVAFDELSGEIHASTKSVLIDTSRYLREATTQRIQATLGDLGTTLPLSPDGLQAAELATGDRVAAWLQVLGAWGKLDDNDAARTRHDTSGLLLGVDAAAGENGRIGAVSGYSRIDFDIDDKDSDGHSDNYHLGFYGGAQLGPWTLSGGAAYTWHDVETRRSVSFPLIAERLSADYDAATAQIYGEAAYRIDRGDYALEPFANLAYVHLDSDAFSEKGGSAALSGDDATSEVTYTTAGLRAARHIAMGQAGARISGMLGWRHAFGDDTPTADLAFAGGRIFAIDGVPVAKDALALSAGLDVDVSANATLGAAWSGQIAEDARDHALAVRLAIRF